MIFSAIKIAPVKEGHEFYPEEEFHVIMRNGTAYVREEDWPLIKAELDKLPNIQ